MHVIDVFSRRNVCWRRIKLMGGKSGYENLQQFDMVSEDQLCISNTDKRGHRSSRQRLKIWLHLTWRPNFRGWTQLGETKMSSGLKSKLTLNLCPAVPHCAFLFFFTYMFITYGYKCAVRITWATRDHSLKKIRLYTYPLTFANPQNHTTATKGAVKKETGAVMDVWNSTQCWSWLRRTISPHAESDATSDRGVWTSVSRAGPDIFNLQ